jgi:hypothetical protein
MLAVHNGYYDDEDQFGGLLENLFEVVCDHSVSRIGRSD